MEKNKIKNYNINALTFTNQENINNKQVNIYGRYNMGKTILLKNEKSSLEKKSFSSDRNFYNNSSTQKREFISFPKINPIMNHADKKSSSILRSGFKSLISMKNIYEKTPTMKKNKKIANGNNNKTIPCELCGNDFEENRKTEHVNLTHPSKILDFIYLGDYNSAKNKKLLDSLEIKHILNCAIECKNFFEKEIKYLHISIKDDIHANIKDKFDVVFNFIENAKTKNEKIFVHCQIGRSRSVAFVVAYLMWRNKNSLNKVLDFVQNKRPIANPNGNFIKQLKEYEFILRRTFKKFTA